MEVHYARHASKVAADQCKYFSESGGLKKHFQRKHSGVGSFACEQCARKLFSQGI